MEFVKMHGLGNDFICLDHFLFSPKSNYAKLAVEYCNRQLGIGGDGLIVMLPSEIADAKMRIFNSDGSEAEMCGNGIRCFAKYVYDVGYIRNSRVTVETLAGVLTLEMEITEGLVESIKVDMGEPCVKPSNIPVLAGGDMAVKQSIEVLGRKLVFTAVSMGNPHCIIFGKEFSEDEFFKLGPVIEKHDLFPKKTNVEFVVVNNLDDITMKVWERGVGPTLACGTGACATVVAAVLEGRTNRDVLVHLPGGDLKINWNEDNHVYMTGPAAYVFKGETLAK
ncbi:MAG: diaminopimelate epimerase [Eubacteriales bacterium]